MDRRRVLLIGMLGFGAAVLLLAVVVGAGAFYLAQGSTERIGLFGPTLTPIPPTRTPT
ncbi:MAG: hypothetical protein GYB64_16345, partial [Chloroflexi bacterium]|nr:hypothetical protein [Chloroflexota bacterium]